VTEPARSAAAACTCAIAEAATNKMTANNKEDLAATAQTPDENGLIGFSFFWTGLKSRLVNAVNRECKDKA
jgi:hypothetical protein